MKKTAYIVIALVVLVGLSFPAARFFSDGPIGMLPGGPFKSGEMLPTPKDWSFAKSVEVIELETHGYSRTVWVVVDNRKRAYIPASQSFPPLKKWHKEVLKDPKATVRIEGKRYPVTLEFIPPKHPDYSNAIGYLVDKYRGNVPTSNENADPAFLFKLNPRR